MRRGWTTGACAAAAAKSACSALLTRTFLDPVIITLPNGTTPAFALAEAVLDEAAARAGIIKDAGDDPDVTHGALVRASVSRAEPGAGVVFRAGPGVGMVTRPGLPIPPGEPAINPVPRRMIREALAEVAAPLRVAGDFVVEVSILDGEELALRTLNGRLGIVGGLSILGTTGIVIPYSCAAWIDSVNRGIDVARALGLPHVAGCTGRASQQAVRALHELDEVALIEMGDFAGGMLKYLRRHPVPRVTVAGGVAKMTKLAQGRLDLHSGRGIVDLAALASFAEKAGGPASLGARIEAAGTAAAAFALARADGIALGGAVAEAAWDVAAGLLEGADIALEILVFDRDGVLAGRAGFRPVHKFRSGSTPARKRRR